MSKVFVDTPNESGLLAQLLAEEKAREGRAPDVCPACLEGLCERCATDGMCQCACQASAKGSEGRR